MCPEGALHNLNQGHLAATDLGENRRRWGGVGVGWTEQAEHTAGRACSTQICLLCVEHTLAVYDPRGGGESSEGLLWTTSSPFS